MEKLDNVYTELVNNMTTQNKLRSEIHEFTKKLKSLEHEYHVTASKGKTALFEIINAVKVYDDSKKELEDIAVFLMSYNELKLYDLCNAVLESDMDISKISEICDAIVETIFDIIPEAFLYVVDITTSYIAKYVNLDLDIKSSHDYNIIDRLCRMIGVLELLQSYLSGLYTFKGGTIEYYKSVLPDDEFK